jgi:hypothetical protein
MFYLSEVSLHNILYLYSSQERNNSGSLLGLEESNQLGTL